LSSPSAEQTHRSLRSILLDHLLSVVVVGVALLALSFLVRTKPGGSPHRFGKEIEAYLNIDSVDWSLPLDRALFRDAYRQFHGASEQAVDSVMNAIEDARLADFTDPTRKVGGGPRALTLSAAIELVPMYAAFVAVFFTVLLITYFLARAAAVWKFVLWKQRRSSYLRRYFVALEYGGVKNAILRADLLAKAAAKGFASIVLFSPAYVIAYSLRTSLDTENIFFLVLLAIISNGVLINFANRLYTLMVAESRKGYVDTALVKGVSSGFRWDAKDGLRRSVLLAPVRRSAGHVFREIYRNARLQFIPSTKEHITFIVTGLVIIEMALNIKGHLCYALLQHILYKEFDIAIAIVFGIYLVVKLTEAGVDAWHAIELRKYDNDI